MKATLDVDARGGIFGDAGRIVTSELDPMDRRVGDQAVDLIRLRLDKVLVNPSGHYRSRIDFTIRQDHLVEIGDSGVVYGPWLEGGGKGTRFRGYSTFRKSIQDVEVVAQREADRAVDRIAGALV